MTREYLLPGMYNVCRFTFKGVIMKKFLTILLALFIAVSSTSTPAFAADPVATTIYGTISAINTDGTITVTGSDGIAYSVILPIGTDPATLLVGSLVKLTGTIDELGLLTITTVEFNQRTDAYYCSQSTDPQPAGQKFADLYGADYLYVQWMFCNDNLGFGEIKNMLKFSMLTGIDTATLQAARLSGMGWGQIRKEYDVPKANNGAKPEKLTGNQNPNKPANGNNGNGNGNGNNGNNGNGNGNSNKP